MKSYTTKGKLNKYSKLVLIGIFWIALWQVGSIIVGNSLLLPSVFETINALGMLVREPMFYLGAIWTLFRCILSILISFVFGICLSWLAYKSKLIRDLMVLPVSFFKAVPVMAIVIYVILLVQADWVAVVACFLMCFPIVYTNILEGLESVSIELLEVGTIYRIGSKNVLRFIYIPSVMPYFNAAMKIVAGLSWKAVVAAEVLSVPEFSLGQGMISAKYYLETPTLFAYIFVIVALSLVLEKLICKFTETFTESSYVGSKLTDYKIIDGKVESAPTLKLTNVSKSFGDKQVLKEVETFVGAGSKIGIVGPSGQGKTTLARIIAGLEKADCGNIDFSDVIKVSYLFQEDRLLPWLNVYDNLVLAISSNCDLTKSKVLEMAEMLEIEDSLWKMPDELSGGMRHRVAIGRTFLANSNLMILDEPFRGLDEELKVRIVNRLWKKETKNRTVLVISHSKEDMELLGIKEFLFLG